MKKVVYFFLIGIITIGSFGNCEKDKKADCTSIDRQIAAAQQAYANDPNTANCKSLRTAFQNMLNSDCAGSLSDEDKNQLQTALNALTCAEQ